MTALTSPSWARVSGPLAPYAGGFRAELEGLGYTPLTAAVHVRLMAHLSRWLAREGLEMSGLSPAVVEGYFAERRAVGYSGHINARALRRLLGYGRRLGVVADAVPVVPQGPIDRVLARYRDWQLRERGLTQATADLNARLVRPFLVDRSAGRDGDLELDGLRAGEVTA